MVGPERAQDVGFHQVPERQHQGILLRRPDQRRKRARPAACRIRPPDDPRPERAGREAQVPRGLGQGEAGLVSGIDDRWRTPSADVHGAIVPGPRVPRQ